MMRQRIPARLPEAALELTRFKDLGEGDLAHTTAHVLARLQSDASFANVEAASLFETAALVARLAHSRAGAEPERSAISLANEEIERMKR